MLEGKLGKIKVQYCAENEANVFSDFGILCFKLIELINASLRQMGVEWKTNPKKEKSSN